jgi:hypothetical protein
MEHARRRTEHRPGAVERPASDERLALPSMIGNQAFTAVAAERRARDEQLILPSTIGNQAFTSVDQLESFPMNVVPFEVEDFFLDRRDELNAGAEGELELDFNWTGRDRAPNLVRWLKRNRHQVWIKLYGGMPAPR